MLAALASYGSAAADMLTTRTALERGFERNPVLIFLGQGATYFYWVPEGTLMLLVGVLVMKSRKKWDVRLPLEWLPFTIVGAFALVNAVVMAW